MSSCYGNKTMEKYKAIHPPYSEYMGRIIWFAILALFLLPSTFIFICFGLATPISNPAKFVYYTHPCSLPKSLNLMYVPHGNFKERILHRLNSLDLGVGHGNQQRTTVLYNSSLRSFTMFHHSSIEKSVDVSQ